MNILLLNWRDVGHPKSGGAELVTMEHAKGWARAGHNVTWLTANYGARPEEVVNGVGMIRRGGFFTVYLFAALYLLANAKRFDIIVDQVHGIPFFSPLFTSKPVVVYIHEIAGEIWDFMFPFPVNVIGKLLERWYFRLYKRCLFWTVAPSTVNELVERGIRREQCIAIPNPLVKDKRLMMKDKMKETKPTYVFVSRVVRMKGIEEVMKAFSFIARTQSNARLWIIGSGEKAYLSELGEMAKTYGIADRVTFYGQVSEQKKFDLLARAHVLLHASVKEGWGLVVLEAAAVGTPAVVYNVNGLKDVVKNGRTGIVIKENVPREMAREAIKLLSGKIRYRDYQKNGKAWVKSLNWPDVVKQSFDLLVRATYKPR